MILPVVLTDEAAADFDAAADWFGLGDDEALTRYLIVVQGASRMSS